MNKVKMKKKGTILGSGAPAILLLSLICLTSPMTVMAGGKQEAMTAGPVKVAVIVYQSGNGKYAGDQLIAGVDLAVRQWNEKGGILGGRKIEWKAYDEGYSPEVAVASIKKAIAEGADVLIYGQDGTTAVPMLQVAKEQGKPGVIVAASSPRLITEGFIGCWKNNYPPAGMPGSVASATADFIQKSGAMTYATVAYESEYCRSNEVVIDETFLKAPSSPKSVGTVYIPYDGTVAEIAFEATKIVSMKPELILCCLWGRETAISFLSKIHELGYKGIVLYNMWSLPQDVVDQIGAPAEGVYTYDNWFYDPSVPANKDFHDAFVKTFNREPTYNEAMGYEAACPLFIALQRAGTTKDLKQIAAAYNSIDDWVTPVGYTLQVVDSQDNRSGQHYCPYWPLLQVKRGKKTVVGKFSLMENVDIPGIRK
jgi:branched-chain amino acid transport system substrate-binding protein